MKRPSVFETGKHITRINEVQKLEDKKNKKKKKLMSSSKWFMNDVEEFFRSFFDFSTPLRLFPWNLRRGFVK